MTFLVLLYCLDQAGSWHSMIRLSQVQIFLLPVQLDLPRVLDHALRPRQPPRHPLRRVSVQDVDRGAEQAGVGLIVGGGQGDSGIPPEGDEGSVWIGGCSYSAVS